MKHSLISVLVISIVLFLLALIGIDLSRGSHGLPAVKYLVVGGVLLVLLLWSNYLHRNAIERGRLRWLQDLGLIVENRKRYWGYKGDYKGYFVRLFVHPESRLHRLPLPDLYVMVYFAPMRRANGERDIALLRKLQEDLASSIFDVRMVEWDCGVIHIARIIPFWWSIRHRTVQRHLDRAIAKVMEHGLKPWPESAVEEWVLRSPELHGPPIEYFQESFNASRGSQSK